MLSNHDTPRLAAITAAMVTTAAFEKIFLPFYLIGSTAIFAASSAFGIPLVAVNWRSIYDMAGKVPEFLLVLVALYCGVVINFLIQSREAVPITHLAGILIYHALFLIFGFSASRVVKVVLMLLGAAAIYAIAIIQYAVRFGDLMHDHSRRDIFGVGDEVVYITFHQNISIVLGLAALAALGLALNRARQILAIGALPLVLLFMYYIEARGALVALVCSLAFLAAAAVWIRSKRLATFIFIAFVGTTSLASGLFYQHAVNVKNFDWSATDTISRTIREIKQPNPGLRLGIWSETWHRISSEPDRLLFGGGIGMYPVIEGFGPPDWLLRKTESSRHYPHNVYLEMLYETGITGLLLFSILTLFPLFLALRRWHLFSLVQKSAISMYVFLLASSQFSGAFARGYQVSFSSRLRSGSLPLAGRMAYWSGTKTSPKELDDSRDPRFTSTVALLRERGFCVLAQPPADGARRA